VHQGSSLNGEVLTAVAAAVGLGLAGRASLDVIRAALGAEDAIGPASLNEPLLGGFIVWEHPGQLHQGESLTKVFARCFTVFARCFHRSSLPKIEGNVKCLGHWEAGFSAHIVAILN